MFKTIVLSALLSLIVGCKDDTSKTKTTASDKTTGTATDKAPNADKVDGELPVAKTDPDMLTVKISASSGSKVAGTITFEAAEGGTDIALHITGLTPGLHGLHLHESGDCSAPDATSAGGHFNPAKVDHGAPEAGTHHRGDLGNVQADTEGMAMKTFTVDFISIVKGDEQSVLGRAVVVHEKADDLKTQPTGGAGARVGCGVIAINE